MKQKNHSCQHKDVFERMNYLYQASQLMALKNRVAASYFGNNMVTCAKKAVLHMEPNLKRTICKCCQSPLIPGETARVRLVSKPIKGVKWTCLICMNTKRYPTKKGYELWLDQPESTVEMLDFTPKSRNQDSQKPSSESTSEKLKEQTETQEQTQQSEDHKIFLEKLIHYENVDRNKQSRENQSISSRSTL